MIGKRINRSHFQIDNTSKYMSNIIVFQMPRQCKNSFVESNVSSGSSSFWNSEGGVYITGERQ